MHIFCYSNIFAVSPQGKLLSFASALRELLTCLCLSISDLDLTIFICSMYVEALTVLS